MSGVNLYDRRPSVAFNLSLLPSFLSPIFNRNSSTNWSTTERVRVRGGGGAGEASKASNFIFVKKAGIEGGGWRQRQSDRPAARSVYYERRGEGSLTRRPSAVRVRPFARSFPFGMKMRKGGNFGRSLVKSTKFGTHRSTLSVGWRQ